MVYVAVDHPVGFAFAVLWSAVNHWLAAQGVRWTRGRISTLNAAPLRAHLRPGARPVGRAVYFGLGRFQIMLSTLRPWLHLSRSPRECPRLQVRAPGTASSVPRARR